MTRLRRDTSLYELVFGDENYSAFMPCQVMSSHANSRSRCQISSRVTSSHVLLRPVIPSRVRPCLRLNQSCHDMSPMSHHVTSRHVEMSCHVPSCQCHIMPPQVMSGHVISTHVISRHVSHVMSRHVYYTYYHQYHTKDVCVHTKDVCAHAMLRLPREATSVCTKCCACHTRRPVRARVLRLPRRTNTHPQPDYDKYYQYK